MIKWFLLVSVLFLRWVDQDVKVATWSVGKPDTETYESLSFWIKDDRRAYVRYAHGMTEDDAELRWLGPDASARGFKVSVPRSGACCWVIAPDSVGIAVIDPRTHSTKTFYWEDANPTGDSTNSCSICAKNEKQAQAWLRRYFLH